MFFKLEENKILKIQDNKIIKIVLRLKPFFIEEMSLSENEKKIYNNSSNINKLEQLTKKDVINMFKNYILNSYNLFIQNAEKRIMNLEKEKSKLLDLDFTFDDYATCCLFDNFRKDFAVKINNKWYEFSAEYEKEKFSQYKDHVIDKMFNQCSKEDFIKIFTFEKFFYLNLKINEIQNMILKYEEEKIKLQNCNFDFIL